MPKTVSAMASGGSDDGVTGNEKPPGGCPAKALVGVDGSSSWLLHQKCKVRPCLSELCPGLVWSFTPPCHADSLQAPHEHGPMCASQGMVQVRPTIGSRDFMLPASRKADWTQQQLLSICAVAPSEPGGCCAGSRTLC